MKTTLQYILLAFWFLFILNWHLMAGPIQFQDITLNQARTNAQVEQKLIFIDFTASWCKPCKVMEEEVFNDLQVSQFVNDNYVPIRIDSEIDSEGLIKRFEIQAFPTLMILDPSGKSLIRIEGAMNKDSFQRLIQDIRYIRAFQEAYNRQPKKVQHLIPYVRAVNWINPANASLIAKKFIVESPERRWREEQEWDLIRTYIPGTEISLFRKVLDREDLYQFHTEEFKAFALKGVKDILEKSVKIRNQHHLNQYQNIIKKYPKYFTNADSLILVGEVLYAAQHDPERLIKVLDDYLVMNKNDPELLAYYAQYIISQFFQRDVLLQAIKWAKKSNEIRENFNAYLAISQAYEKLNEFKMAYSYLVMGQQFWDQDEDELLEAHLKRLYEKLSFEMHDGVSTIKRENASDDGRFTLGAGNKRLMYGYPIPTSTSHFIVNINGQLASNSPKLSDQGLTYLKGYLHYEGQGMTPMVQINFEFEGVQISQTLTPVDREFQPLSTGYAQYYQVSYDVKNLTQKNKKIGLGVLFDTMIDDNDFCVISADGVTVPTEMGFLASGMPEQLLFYRTPGDTADMMGTAILIDHGATTPDKMVIGRWPYLHNVTWKLNPKKVEYGDSAYFLKWENRQLRPNTSMQFVTYYGLPDHKEPELNLIIEDHNMLTRTENIYFPHQSDQLDLNAKMKISDLLEDENIDIQGVLLNGYTDVTGNTDYNFNLSKRRIANVGKIFSAYQIPFVPKPYGMEKSNQNIYNMEYGNVWDRRVEIILYYKMKESDLLSTSSLSNN